MHGITFGLGWGVGTTMSKRLGEPLKLQSTMQGAFTSCYFGLGYGIGAISGGFVSHRCAQLACLKSRSCCCRAVRPLMPVHTQRAATLPCRWGFPVHYLIGAGVMCVGGAATHLARCTLGPGPHEASGRSAEAQPRPQEPAGSSEQPGVSGTGGGVGASFAAWVRHVLAGT